MAVAPKAKATVAGWSASKGYAVGDLVSYKGVTYRALQAAMAQPAWNPVAAQALWAPVGGSTPTPPPPTAPPTTWGASSIYTAGMTVVVGDVTYRANWWTQGTDPLSHSGPTGSGQPWTLVSGSPPPKPPVPSVPSGVLAEATTDTGTTLRWQDSSVPGGGTVSGYQVYRNGQLVGSATETRFAVSGLTAKTAYNFTVVAVSAGGSSAPSAALSVTTATGAPPPPPPPAPAWVVGSVYTAGMTATVNGVVYRANWWTQGNDPTTNSGPSGSGKPWTAIGGAPSPTAPGVPKSLAAFGTSSTGTVLTWQAPTGGATQYTVRANGQTVGTTTATTFSVAGLTPATGYDFTVSARNGVGESAPTGPLAVTTRAGGDPDPTRDTVFAPYIDMSLYTSQELTAIQAVSGIRHFTLAFVLDSGGGHVGWGGSGTIQNDTLPNGTSIQSQIQSIRSAGADVTISFGGANGTEPALAAKNASSLQAAYQAVIDRYHVKSLDFDIEGWAVTNTASIALRDQALVGLKAANPGLKISLTLPVLPTGLDANGLAVLRAAKQDGLNPDVVNIMAMDYGPAVDNGGQMGANAISAALNTIQQIEFIGLTSKIGITPMIGVNDVATEVFTLADAQMLLDFARGNEHVERLSMWSVSRDNGSGAGSPWASPVSSGLQQQDYAFSNIFKGFD